MQQVRFFVSHSKRAHSHAASCVVGVQTEGRLECVRGVALVHGTERPDSDKVRREITDDFPECRCPETQPAIAVKAPVVIIEQPVQGQEVPCLHVQLQVLVVLICEFKQLDTVASTTRCQHARGNLEGGYFSTDAPGGARFASDRRMHSFHTSIDAGKKLGTSVLYRSMDMQVYDTSHHNFTINVYCKLYLTLDC